MARLFQLLKGIYYGSTPGALRGPQALYEQAKKQKIKGVTMKKVKEFLSSQPVYTKHRPARRNYKRNKIRAWVPGAVVQIDIWDLQAWKDSNEYLYVLLAYDTFSKFLQGVPLLNRKPQTVEDALEIMIEASPFDWQAIYWDREGAFVSKKIQDFLASRNIHNYTTKSVVKSPGVERSIRTLRTLLQRRFEASKTRKWVPELPKIIQNYNRRKHSTTKIPPNDLARRPYLWSENEQGERQNIKLPPIGSFVHLNRKRGIFEKEASNTWTEEVFKVVRHNRSPTIPLIYIEDLLGEAIEGGLYPEEYQVVDWNGKKQGGVVIKERKLRGRPREYFVTYPGWPHKFDEWITRQP